MEYLKYGDSFSLINKGDTNCKGEYLTLVKYKDEEPFLFCQASAKGVKEPQDYLWEAIPASGNTKKTGDYVESNDFLMLKNINSTGVERYLTIGQKFNGPSNGGVIAGVLSEKTQSTQPISFWRLSLNNGTNNISEISRKIPLDEKTSVYLVHEALSQAEGGESLYAVIDLNPANIPNAPPSVLVAARNLTMEWGIETSSQNNNDAPDNNNEPYGDINPRPIPDIPANTQFTITLINNEPWLRSAKLNIDGDETILDVGAKSAISKAYKTVKGTVTISLLDSQHGVMLIPLHIKSSDLGKKGKTVSFGSQKPGDDDPRPGYMDVFVHIDWDTDIL